MSILRVDILKTISAGVFVSIFLIFLDRVAYPSSTPEPYHMPTMTQYTYGQPLTNTVTPQGPTMQYYLQGQGYAPYSSKLQK